MARFIRRIVTNVAALYAAVSADSRLLLETGDVLLMETGDRLLLE